MGVEYEGGAPDYLMPGVRILRASRQACPVCGHALGDCAGESIPPNRIVGDNVRLKKPVPETMVRVTEDIYGERQITPFTRARVLLAAAGTDVTESKARELGILE